MKKKLDRKYPRLRCVFFKIKKKSLKPTIFQTLKFIGPKFFWDLNFIGPKNFLNPTFFWMKITALSLSLPSTVTHFPCHSVNTFIPSQCHLIDLSLTHTVNQLYCQSLIIQSPTFRFTNPSSISFSREILFYLEIF